VTYEDGDTETCTTRTMRNRASNLCLLTRQPPAGVSVPGPEAATVNQATATLLSGKLPVALPAQWPLQTRHGVAEALGSLMPGEYASSHITKIANFIQAYGNQKGVKGGWVPTSPEEMEPLARVVDFWPVTPSLTPLLDQGP
jgi:hypothetical protein